MPQKKVLLNESEMRSEKRRATSFQARLHAAKTKN